MARIHDGQKMISRILEVGENLSPGGPKLTLCGDALEGRVVKSNDVVYQPVEKTSSVVTRVNRVPPLHLLNPLGVADSVNTVKLQAVTIKWVAVECLIIGRSKAENGTSLKRDEHMMPSASPVVEE